MPPTDHNRPELVLSEALRRRESQNPPSNAYRIINGPGDGAPAGLTLDSYDGWLVMTARAHVAAETVTEWVQVAQARLNPEGIVLKTLATRATDSRSEVVQGILPEQRTQIHEGGVQLLVALDDGVQTGLFLDHRETRCLAQDYVRGGEVLNLFSYTCAFSVHAAHAGASRVTSVDVSRKALDWGRENMRANEMSPDEHRWFSDDVVRHVGRGPDSTYQLVILDPPVFGRGQGRAFSLRADLGALVEGSFRKLVDGGVLIFSTHAQTLSEQDVLNAAHAAASRVGGQVRVIERRGLPTWDHPVVSGQSGDAEDRGNYLKTLVLRFESR